MELILKQDVENLGFTDDIVEVKNGYGRNFLIPKGFAVMATPSTKKMLEETLRQRGHKEKKQIETAQKQADKAQALELKITAKAGAGDKLFGSISNADLADALSKEGIEIDKKYVSILGGNIKRLGQYQATLRFHREAIATITFDVVAEAS
jgi:large subunit ribosomal protein L9